MHRTTTLRIIFLIAVKVFLHVTINSAEVQQNENGSVSTMIFDDCPLRCIQSSEFNGCQCLSTEWQTQDQAMSACRRQGGIMAYVDSDRKLQIFRAMSVHLHSDGYWIGVSQNKDQYYYYGDRMGQGNEKLINSAAFWAPGYPTYREACVCLTTANDLRLNDKKCDRNLFFVCQANTAPRCPTGFSLRNGKCLMVVTEKRTWSEAAQICNQNYAQLAAPTSKAEYMAIADLIRNSWDWNHLDASSLITKPVTGKLGYYSVWAGLIRRQVGWAKADDMHRVTLSQTMWKDGEPNNADGNENCVEYYDRMNDVPCLSRRHMYVCEIIP